MEFTRAIVRPPSENFADGLTTSSLGSPDHHVAISQHEEYCAALRRGGLTITVLPPDARFPDSTFVEDTAIVTSRGALLARPGAPSRLGEVEEMRPLRQWFGELRKSNRRARSMAAMCVRPGLLLIGISQRTNTRAPNSWPRGCDPSGSMRFIDIAGPRIYVAAQIGPVMPGRGHGRGALYREPALRDFDRCRRAGRGTRRELRGDQWPRSLAKISRLARWPNRAGDIIRRIFGFRNGRGLSQFGASVLEMKTDLRRSSHCFPYSITFPLTRRRQLHATPRRPLRAPRDV